MAGIDKIYGTEKQYDMLKDWLAKNRPKYLKSLYPKGDTEIFPISCFSEEQDRDLKKNCPIRFVQKRLVEQYGKKYWSEHENR